jgi:DNA-directed RNA polymerase specialized sigma subunit
MKSMLPKQKSYIPRFALILNTIDCFFDDKQNLFEISKESMLKAEKLSNYFIAMAKKIKIDNVEKADVKTVLIENKNKSMKEKFELIYKQNPNFSKKEISEMLGVSRQTIYNLIKEIENGK